MTNYYVDRPAGYWIGHPGALLPLPGIKGKLTRSVERAATYKTSAAGQRRAYLSARRAPLRQWDVTLPHLKPSEAAVLHGLLMETDPPYVWVDVWSRVTNLLTPAAAGLVDIIPALVPAGRQPLTGGGYAPTAVANPDGALVYVAPAPVVPDQPVTISAYLAAPVAGTVTAVFLDSAGAIIGVPSVSAAVSGESTLTRASLTLTPPGNAAAVSIRIDGASIIAQPAVTWTSELVEYGPGGGAAQVIIPSLTESIEQAVLAASGKRLAEVTFTVYEVG
ncbi:hypothetical protein [uncultured Friedmanniella sp.]|uniref:hypothetical protein n=1 Tax=uncultured Friedmanniella sp. TaxID=335381 RepID=UPI0035CCA27F